MLGLGVSVIGLFICLSYRNTIQVYQNTNKVNDKIFDAELITVGDYSSMGRISPQCWANFMQQFEESEKDEVKKH